MSAKECLYEVPIVPEVPCASYRVYRYVDMYMHNICMYRDIYPYVYVFMYMYMCIYMYMCMYVYIYIYIYICICICICRCINMHVYMYMYMCIYIYIYVCICVHMYTCIYVCMCICHSNGRVLMSYLLLGTHNPSCSFPKSGCACAAACFPGLPNAPGNSQNHEGILIMMWGQP